MESNRLELQARPRTVTGKRTRHLRRQGLVPGHVFGHGKSVDVEIDSKALDDVLRHAGLNTLITLRLDDEARSVMLRSVERNGLRRAILNVDLQEVALDELIKVQVPIVLTGESPAAKAGAVLLRLLDHLTLEVLPANVPHSLHVDVTNLEQIDQTIHVKDLALPHGVRVLDDADSAVVKVAEARAAVASEAAAGKTAEGAPAETEESTAQ
jgi:large subunit ribosomal protein L25